MEFPITASKNILDDKLKNTAKTQQLSKIFFFKKMNNQPQETETLNSFNKSYEINFRQRLAVYTLDCQT